MRRGASSSRGGVESVAGAAWARMRGALAGLCAYVPTQHVGILAVLLLVLLLGVVRGSWVMGVVAVGGLLMVGYDALLVWRSSRARAAVLARSE